MLNHHSKFFCHQLGSPPFVSRLIKNLRDYSHKSRMIEKAKPGIPNKKKGRCLDKLRLTFRRRCC